MERFIVDQMLIRLGRWLRLLGLDVANPDGLRDSELVMKARRERRILITRDRGLAQACLSAGGECILIVSSLLEEQLKEMARSGVDLKLDPQRCTLCNSPLKEAESPARQLAWECQGCGKLYWAGSHWRRMEEMLERVRSQL
jgi:uncharacterized protein with PIN domain